jgi:hypothetical protein
MDLPALDAVNLSFSAITTVTLSRTPLRSARLIISWRLSPYYGGQH